MTPLERKACPRCGRTVAWRVIRGPRVNRGRPIPALKQPVLPRNQTGDVCAPSKTLREQRYDQAATPRGWDPIAWQRADAAARRAVEADRLARECYPPFEVGFVELNRARGRIMAELDRQAENATAARSVKCTYCEADAETTDHVIPRSAGGTNDPSNLVPACKSCNSRKGTLPVELLDADLHIIAAWLIARGWRPVVPRLRGRNSSWLSPDPTEHHVFYSRASAIRHAAWGKRPIKET